MSGVLKVLLAEDSPTVLMFFKTILESEGLEVITATDGVEAVSKFFRNLPDVVVSDVEMPVMNGYHLCRIIRNDPETRAVPFILLTSLTEGRYEYWGQEVGASRYIRKEDGVEKLAQAVRELAVPRVYPDAVRGELAAKYADPAHILDQLNRMMDEKLFRMTLTNTFTSMSFENLTLKEMVKKALEILIRIFRVESISAVIFNTEEVHFFIHSQQPLDPDYIQSVADYCVGEFLEDKTTITLENTKFDLEPLCEIGEDPVPFRQNVVRDFFRRLSDDLQMALHVMPPAQMDLPNDVVDLLEDLMGVISIATAHTFNQERVRSLSVIDSLTHLYNRGHFMSLLNAEYRRTIRHNLNLSVIFIDIDNFKSVNDTYGHLSGDLVLKALSETIKACTRTSDVAGRYGGEEFVVYLPETNLENAGLTAERIRKSWEARVIPINKTQSVKTTMSLGVASVAEIDPSGEITDILEIADQKLYKAKQSGKNRVVM